MESKRNNKLKAFRKKKINSKPRKIKRKGEFTQFYEGRILVYPIANEILVNKESGKKYNYLKDNFDKGTYTGKVLWGDNQINIGYAFFVVHNHTGNEKEGFTYSLRLRVEVDRQEMPFQFKEGVKPQAGIALDEEFNVLIKFKKEDFIRFSEEK